MTTHYADEATLEYIKELNERCAYYERQNAEQGKLLNEVVKERDEWKIGAQEGRKAQEKYMELCAQLVACQQEKDEYRAALDTCDRDCIRAALAKYSENEIE